MGGGRTWGWVLHSVLEMLLFSSGPLLSALQSGDNGSVIILIGSLL